MLSFYHKKLEKEVWVKYEVRRKTMVEISTEINSMENTCVCAHARAYTHTHTHTHKEKYQWNQKLVLCKDQLIWQTLS